MTNRYLNQLFTPPVKAAQEANGSRRAYARGDSPVAERDVLTGREAMFISRRDSFYMASNSGAGWPYVQHRGGPAGFVKVLDERTLGLADYRGNRQYISVGNLEDDNRVALFFMDYVNRARLKVLGHARAVGLEEGSELTRALSDLSYAAQPERGLIIEIDSYDWNCPQHITPRYTIPQIEEVVAPLKARIAELEAELAKGKQS